MHVTASILLPCSRLYGTDSLSLSLSGCRSSEYSSSQLTALPRAATARASLVNHRPGRRGARPTAVCSLVRKIRPLEVERCGGTHSSMVIEFGPLPARRVAAGVGRRGRMRRRVNCVVLGSIPGALHIGVLHMLRACGPAHVPSAARAVSRCRVVTKERESLSRARCSRPRAKASCSGRRACARAGAPSSRRGTRLRRHRALDAKLD